MDIATKFASGQEAVEAIFRKDKQPQGHRKPPGGANLFDKMLKESCP
jgi:hypothetical protein